MTQAPKRIRVIQSKNRVVCIDDGPDRWSLEKWDAIASSESPHTEHFYTLEEPMTQEEPRKMTGRKDYPLGEAAKKLDALIDKQRERTRQVREGVEKRNVHPSNLDYADGVLDGLREAKDVLLNQLYPEGDCRDVAV